MFDAQAIVSAIRTHIGPDLAQLEERWKIAYRFPQGASAFFVKLNDEWGWKGYYKHHQKDDYGNSMDRDYNYDVALYAGEHGVGVPVGDKCDITINGLDIPGFFQRFAPDPNGYEYGQEGEWDAIQSLREEMQNIGLDTVDILGGNVGMYNGKLVARDVSHSRSDANMVRAKLKEMQLA